MELEIKMTTKKTKKPSQWRRSGNSAVEEGADIKTALDPPQVSRGHKDELVRNKRKKP